MPWIDLQCPCGASKRRYWQPSHPRPQYCSRGCARHGVWQRHQAEGRRPWRRYTRTPEMEAALRKAAQTHSGVKALWQRDPRFRAVPYGTVKRWCLVLGLRPPRAKAAWTPAEEALCTTLWREGRSPERIATALRRQGYPRTAGAVVARMGTLHEPRHQGFLTLEAVAQGLAVDHHAVARWVDRGLLAVHHTSGPRRYVSVPALQRFLAEHPWQVANRRPEVVWLIGVLTQPRERGPGPAAPPVAAPERQERPCRGCGQPLRLRGEAGKHGPVVLCEACLAARVAAVVAARAGG